MTMSAFFDAPRSQLRAFGDLAGVDVVIEFLENIAIIRIHALIHRIVARCCRVSPLPDRRRSESLQCSATSGMILPISIA